MPATGISLAMPLVLGPEAELLICCACLQPTPAQRERIGQLLSSGVDWPSLQQLALVHGLRPLLCRQLESFVPAGVPKAIYAELWGHQQQLIKRNQEMAAELVAILRLLDEHGIPVIPYKGPLLAATVYGDLALRVFGDLDLLLRPEDILRAKALLATRGYRPQHPMAPVIEASLVDSRMHYHLALVRELPTMLVELHWKTDAEFPVESPNDTWWSNLPTTWFQGWDVRCFSSKELLLVLCLHGSKHFWASLGWLVDVAELIRQQPELDWAWIIARAEAMQASRRLALGLHLLRDLLAVELPDPAQLWLTNQTEAGRLARALAPDLFDPAAQEPGAFKRLQLNFVLYETRPQRLRHVMDVVFKPGLVEWTQWSLPGPLMFLYLPVRWCRLAWKHLLALFRKN